MRILVACEESQAVCKAFRVAGHEAYSCDTDPCSGGQPDWHIQGDVTPLLAQDWDMIIAFPPCTYLCSSGMHWTTRGLRDPQLTENAIDFVRAIMDAPCDKIAIENPIGCISSRIRKPDQIVQPWMFGENASKKTCLWLKGLEPLRSTGIIPPRGYENTKSGISLELSKFTTRCNGYTFVRYSSEYVKPVWGNQTPSGQNKLGPSKDRATLRSKTCVGIAKAMADQWG